MQEDNRPSHQNVQNHAVTLINKKGLSAFWVLTTATFFLHILIISHWEIQLISLYTIHTGAPIDKLFKISFIFQLLIWSFQVYNKNTVMQKLVSLELLIRPTIISLYMYIYLFVRPQQLRVLGYDQKGPSINIGEKIWLNLIEFDHCGVCVNDYCWLFIFQQTA